MRNKLINSIVLSAFSICILLTNCQTRTETSEKIAEVPPNTYLNHSDSAHYVGMNTCKLCHQNVYNTFINTGMGKSFGLATKQKSSADFKNAFVSDVAGDMGYSAFFQNDTMYIEESRSKMKNFKYHSSYGTFDIDLLHNRVEKVDYIIGSGQHTNSHIQNVNGYLNQMPMTFYTQKKKWDLPPGFENGMNTHFTRKIGLECMSCHNGYPDFVLGSENKFTMVPNGIDCERCHGPGSIHVNQRTTGSKVDTSKYIDYSIVNPSKLPIDLQFDICQRCHLQGNAVLKNEHSFYDFKPGQKLSDFISVFLPKYKNADDEFIMASHADRLKQSPCFIKSLEKQKTKDALKPYKGAMTCITCHNPHVSVRETNKEVFNDACKNCHVQSSVGSSSMQLPGQAPSKVCKTNCVNCHMPSSGSTDIPHVTVHDHYIRKPISKKEKDKIKEFIGLYAINEKDPSAKTKARAYIQEYERFKQDKSYLDSARKYLADKTPEDIFNNFHELVQICAMTQDFDKIFAYMKIVTENACYIMLNKKSYDNRDAWAAYNVADAYYYKNNLNQAAKWYEKACNLAAYNLDFRIKYGTTLARLNRPTEAEEQFKFVISENPKKAQGYTNLGFLRFTQNKLKEAFENYTKAYELDPDSEPLLLNMAGYYVQLKDKTKAIELLKRIVKKNPKNQQAQDAIKQLQNVSL
jgi:tetratricopeptide (TPR) repeat protein